MSVQASRTKDSPSSRPISLRYMYVPDQLSVPDQLYLISCLASDHDQLKLIPGLDAPQYWSGRRESCAVYWSGHIRFFFSCIDSCIDSPRNFGYCTALMSVSSKPILIQCTPDNGEMVKREFWIKGKVPRERIFLCSKPLRLKGTVSA